MLSLPERLISDIELIFRDIIQWKELSDVTKFGINFRVWEDFSMELFNNYLGYNFINVNSISDNHAAIDIGDEENKLCIQVTKNVGSEKIKHTIKMFEKYKLYEKYDELKILLITQDKDIPKFRSKFETNGKYKFSKENIIGLDSIIKDISNLNVEKMKSFLDFCVEYFPSKKITSGEEYSSYNLVHNISVSSDYLNKDLDKIKDIIITDKNYEEGLKLVDDYLENNSDDLDIANNLKGVIYYNGEEDYEEGLKYFKKSIKINSKFEKGRINLVKSYYRLYLKSEKNATVFQDLIDIINKNNNKIIDKELKKELLEIYGSTLLIQKEDKLYDKYINEILKEGIYSDVIYDTLFKMYQINGNKELAKQTLLEGLEKYPNSYYLNLGKIYLDLEKLDKSAVRYNIDIIPKINKKQKKQLSNILERYFKLIPDIEKSKEPLDLINQKKYQVFLLSYQLKVHEEKRFQELYRSIDLSLVDKYHIWKYDLLRINDNLINRDFEISYKIIEESVVKDEIPFVEYVKLASIFLYHGGYNQCNNILNQAKYLKDYSSEYVEYWEYLIQSEIFLGNKDKVKELILEAKGVFKETQYYSNILKIELSTVYRNLDTQENIDSLSKTMMEYHKINGDTDEVKLIQLEEGKDPTEELKKKLPAGYNPEGHLIIEKHYINNIVPHYFIQGNYGSYLELITKRQPYLPLKMGFLDIKKQNELVDKKINGYKFMLTYDSLINLQSLKLLEYYQLKNLLRDGDDKFELLISRELINTVSTDLLSKEDDNLRKIYQFIIDKKIKVIEHKGKIKDFLPGGKIREDKKTHIIFPKWLINSISFCKDNNVVLITDDTSNLETSHVYGIEVINSLIINGKKFKNPIFKLDSKNESIMNISKLNYTFLSFNTENLLYIYKKDTEKHDKVTIYQKYNINSSFFYLCNQINVNRNCNLESFFSVFGGFAVKIKDVDKDKLRIYLVFFIYLFNEFFKSYISKVNKLKDNKEIYTRLYLDIGKYVDYNTYTVIHLMNKLDIEQLNKLLEDFEFLSGKDKEFGNGFGKYIPNSIKKIINHRIQGKQI